MADWLFCSLVALKDDSTRLLNTQYDKAAVFIKIIDKVSCVREKEREI